MNNSQTNSSQQNNLFLTQQITFLPCSDREETVQFYRDMLALKLVRDQGDCVIFEITKSAYLGFCLRDPITEAGKIILTFISEHVDDWHTKLSQHAVKILGQPTYNQKYGIYHFFFYDPNGYKIEIQCFDKPLE